MYTFSLNTNQIKKYEAWQALQTHTAMIEQKANPPNNIPCHVLESCWEEGYPYDGAIGGSATFHFTQTSIGTIATANYRDKVIDLTEYESW